MLHSIYVHIPFCRHRCAYCDFNTYAGQGDLIPAYVDALRREIETVGKAAPSHVRVHTIYFGGGTPSLLTALQLEAVLDAVRSCFDVEPDLEISLEANPGTVSERSLIDMRAAGVNRLSFGIQSANGEELRLLERSHDFGDVLNAFAWARRAGFGNLNADLIYGLPEQSFEVWRTTVRRVLDLHPEHVSAYSLTLEHGTPFAQWVDRGLLPAPDPDLAADMYEWLSEELEAAGYEQYEISNWAIPDCECKHNLQYWRGLPYLGFGAGAHGYAGGYRYSSVLGIQAYIDRLAVRDARSDAASAVAGTTFPFSPAAITKDHQTSKAEMTDFMLMGLRLVRDGITAEEFERRFGRTLADTYGRPLAELTNFGLLEWADSSGIPKAERDAAAIRLTRRGRLLGNRVFSEFVAGTTDPIQT